jgi:hypothetical protein
MIWIAMDLGLPNPNAECPAPQPAQEASGQTPKKTPPGMLRPLLPGNLLAFRKLLPGRTGLTRTISPTLAPPDSIDGIQT